MPSRAGTSSALDELPQCDCKLCSAAVDKFPKTISIAKARRMANKRNRVKFNTECQNDCEGAPCRVKCADIIRRNKRAVRILSTQVRAQKSLMPPCDSRYDSVRLFPTAKHATTTRWQPAYSLARASDTDTSQCTKKKRKKKSEQKPSFSDMVTKRHDCACELMGRAIRADLHRYLGLRGFRDRINNDVIDTPPPVQSPCSSTK